MRRAFTRPASGAAILLGCVGFAAGALGAGVPHTVDSPVDAPDATPTVPQQPLRHEMRALDLTEGERLVYEINWAGMLAGTSVLSVKWKRDFEGAQAYHVECETRTNRFFAALYPVEDDVITIIDAEGGFSRLFQMSKNEHRVRQTEYIRFDYEKDLAVYEQRRPGPWKTRSRKLVHIDGPMQDPLSCLYYFRASDVGPGDRVCMPVHTARRSWPLTVEVGAREELTVPGFGKLWTMRVEPTMHFPGIFVRKGRMTIWVEEKTLIPVRMNVDIPIGSITVLLADAENAPLVRVGAGAKPGDPAPGEPAAKEPAAEEPGAQEVPEVPDAPAPGARKAPGATGPAEVDPPE